MLISLTWQSTCKTYASGSSPPQEDIVSVRRVRGHGPIGRVVEINVTSAMNLHRTATTLHGGTPNRCSPRAICIK